MAESWEGEHGYAPKDHNHDSKYAKLGHTHDGIGDLPAHNHDGRYSKLGHNHDTVYSKTSHNHDDVYSKLGHVHNYAASNHNHDDVYSKLGHSHELIDMLPVGTVLWFGQDVTLSSKWTVCTNLIGRYPLGATSGIGGTVEAGLPNITGEIYGHAAGTDGAYGGTFRGVHQSGASLDALATGSFVVGDKAGGSSGMAYTADSDTYTLKFDASKSSTVYKDDYDTVTPPSVNLLPYIKIA